MIYKRCLNSHRGITGVESAIVLIAFVLVAGALAFVVLNMGFGTTQQAKTTIISGLVETSSSIMVSGNIIGIGCTSAGTCSTTPVLNATSVPIKIATAGGSVSFDPDTTVVKYLSNSIEYGNIYKGTINTTVANSLDAAMALAVAAPYTYIDSNPVSGAVPTNTVAFTYWQTTNTPQDSNLDTSEHAALAIAFRDADRPQALDKMRIEIILTTGATMTVERTVPSIANLVVNLS